MADLTNADVNRNLMGAINKMASAGGSADMSKQLTIQSSILVSIKQGIDSLLIAWQGDALQQAEDANERREQDQMLLATLGKLTKSISKKDKDDKKKIEADDTAFKNLNIGARIAAAGITFLYGAIKGFVQGMRRILGNIKIPIFTKIFDKVTLSFTKIKNGLSGFVGKINSSLIKPIRTLFGSKIEKVGAFIKQAQDALGIVSKEGGFFSSIRTFFMTLKSPGMVKLMKFFSGIGQTFGKILAPLGFIFSAFAGIKNAIAMFNDSDLPIGAKIINAIGGFLGGFVGNFVGGLADVLKSIISWIAKKFGFENVSKWLDSFSFEELITAGFNDFIKLPITWFNDQMEKLANIFYSEDSFGTKVKEIFGLIMDGLLSIITAPYDFIKSLIAGLAGMFGADKLQEMLNAWDFKTLFTEQWKKIKGFFGLGDSTPTNVEPITREYAQKQAALNKRMAERDAERAKQRVMAITSSPITNSSNIQLNTVPNTVSNLEAMGRATGMPAMTPQYGF